MACLGQNQDRIDELLTRFKLNDFRKYKAHNLSGGMKRRFEIARAKLFGTCSRNAELKLSGQRDCKTWCMPSRIHNPLDI